MSSFLPVGPCGQSAFAFLQLAAQLRHLTSVEGAGLGGHFTAQEAAMMTTAIYGLSIVSALFMMGLGFFWLSIAISTCVDLATKKRLSFNM